MLFNSWEYLLFFLIIWLLTLSCNRQGWTGWRNLILLLASYYFYGSFHYLYPILLLYVTVIAYWGGDRIYQRMQERKSARGCLTAVLVLSLLPLFFFKYIPLVHQNFWLPVGLSFFTFQALTYSMDIYRQILVPSQRILEVGLFIGFFPTLLSGPIERARNLIPQLRQAFPLSWETFCGGGQIFLWGLFKKVVIADRLSSYVDSVYASPLSQSGSTLALTAILYSFQIYCDFSGYASMAIGTGKALGISLSPNFRYPYFAVSIKDFWKRWHISLTSWFTEYVYLAVGGNRVSTLRWIINICFIFLLSGAWHGVTWSFLVWGGIHALFYLGEYYWGFKRKNIFYSLFVFLIVTLAWIFFRITNINQAGQIIYKISTNLLSPISLGSSAFTTLLSLLLLCLFILIEYLSFRGFSSRSRIAKTVFLLIMISLFGRGRSDFVYFQF